MNFGRWLLFCLLCGILALNLFQVPAAVGLPEPGYHDSMGSPLDQTRIAHLSAVRLSSLMIKLVGQVRSEDGHGIGSVLTIYTIDLQQLTGTQTDDRGFYSATIPDYEYYLVDVSPIGSLVTRFGLKFEDYMQMSKLVKRTSPIITVNFDLRRCGNLWIKAYDSQGRKIRLGGLDNFTDADIGVFPLSTMVYDRSRGYLRRGILDDEPWDESEPALQVPTDEPVKIAAVWEVPAIGKLVFEADNAGQGFKLAWKEVVPINLVFEFARTEYEGARKQQETRTNEGYPISENVTTWLRSAEKDLEAAKLLQMKGDDSGCSNASYRALSSAVRAGEQLAMDVARKDIGRYRTGEVTISLVDQDGKPLSDRTVTVAQVSHDFAFGAGGVFGPSDLTGMEILRGFGVEVAQLQFDIKQIHPSLGSYQYTDLDRTVNGLEALGYRLAFHDFFYLSTEWKTSPVYYYSLTPDALALEAGQYTTNVVSRIRDRAIFWTVIDEANAWYGNPFGLDHQAMLKVVAAAFKAARASQPDGIFNLGFAHSIGEIRNRSWDNYTINPEEFLNLADQLGIPYDGISPQSWQGTLEQGLDFGTWSNLLDYYSLRGKKIYLTEGGYCNFEGRPDLKMERWWHDGYNNQTQADYLRYYFTIAFSKPYVGGVGWFEVIDRESHADDPIRFGRGLLDANLKPKPAAYVLRDLLKSWTTRLNLTTDSSGAVSFRGFAGDYELQVSGYQKAKFHVVERGQEAVTVVLAPTSTTLVNTISERSLASQVDYVAYTIVVTIAVAVSVTGLLVSRRLGKKRMMKAERRRDEG